jgi:hypothetical protein
VTLFPLCATPYSDSSVQDQVRPTRNERGELLHRLILVLSLVLFGFVIGVLLRAECMRVPAGVGFANRTVGITAAPGDGVRAWRLRTSYASTVPSTATTSIQRFLGFESGLGISPPQAQHRGFNHDGSRSPLACAASLLWK